jgi:hypothetical protein
VVTLTNAYSSRSRSLTVAGGHHRQVTYDTRTTGGRYEVRVAFYGSSYARELAGHVGGDQPSISDPALGR